MEVGSVRKETPLQTPLSIAPGGSYFWVVTGGFLSLAQVAGPSPMFLLHISCHPKGVIPLPLTKHLAIWDYFVGKGLPECVMSFTYIVAPALLLDSWSHCPWVRPGNGNCLFMEP